MAVAGALPELLSIDRDAAGRNASGSGVGHGVRPALGVWAAAATAGVGLAARGRLLPRVGPGGTDAWRIGPLDAADLAWLRELAARFPAAAHALAIPGTRPMRIRSAESLIRAFWDAIADTLVRTAAAPRVVASPAFAAAEPTPVGDLAEWLADTTDGLAAGARLGLRIEAVPAAAPEHSDGRDIDGWDDEADSGWSRPDELDEDVQDEDEPDQHGTGDAGAAVAPPAFRLVLQLRSTADPSLIVDASSLWDQPEVVLTRFGTQAETDLLLALRRGAAVWPPLEPGPAPARPAA